MSFPAALGARAQGLTKSRRRAVHRLSADGRPASQPVSVEVRDDLHVQGIDAHLRAARDRRRRRASRDLHGRPQAPADDPSRPGSDIPSAAGKATRSWSTRSATTTSSGSTAAARRTPSNSTRSNGGRAINYGTLINEFTLNDPERFPNRCTLKFTATHIRPDLDLIEFICLERQPIRPGGCLRASQRVSKAEEVPA